MKLLFKCPVCGSPGAVYISPIKLQPTKLSVIHEDLCWKCAQWAFRVKGELNEKRKSVS